jgi:hypothetical protein
MGATDSSDERCNRKPHSGDIGAEFFATLHLHMAREPTYTSRLIHSARAYACVKMYHQLVQAVE